jgi:hypothetical protein
MITPRPYEIKLQNGGLIGLTPHLDSALLFFRDWKHDSACGFIKRSDLLQLHDAIEHLLSLTGDDASPAEQQRINEALAPTKEL